MRRSHGAGTHTSYLETYIMKWQEIRKLAATKIAEAKAVQEAADKDTRHLTEPEVAQVDALLAEAQKLDAQADTLKKLDTALESRNKPEDVETPIALGPASVPAEAKDAEAVARGGWHTLGEFATAIFKAHPQVEGKMDNRLLQAAVSGMSQGVGADGGFLVPPSFSSTIWEGLNRVSDSLLARTDNYTITGESLTFVANAETARTVGNRWGGVRGYWLAEADQVTSSKPTYRKLKLEPQQLGVFCYVTDKLLRNSAVALEQYLTRAATDEINFLVGDAIINGNGAGKPLGVLGSGSLVSVDKETGQAAATVVAENIVKMWTRLHPSSKPNSIWLVNPSIEGQLPLMTIGVGTSGLPAYMPPGGLSQSSYGTLLGRPVVPCEYCAALGTVGDIILCDLKAYATGTRGGIESAMSIHLRFDFAESAYRFLFECDGQPWCQSAITPYKGSDSLSPFVALATRS